MRAVEPRLTGFATNPEDGARSFYEVFGPEDAERTILFLPTWSLVKSRIWKMQVPYFARRGFQVVTVDGRGNGRSDRPESGYTTDHFAGDALAVLDELAIERVALVALSAGGRWGAQLAALHPDLVTHLVMIAPGIRLEGAPRQAREQFLSEPPDREGWHKYNAVHWREDYRDFVEWFVGEIFSEPHSTKPFDDAVGWAMGTTPEILIATILESRTPRLPEYCRSIQCPTLFLHGDDDRISELDTSRQVQAVIPGAEIVVIEGGGHSPNVREPVKTNLLIHEFLNRRHGRIDQEATYARA